MSSKHGPLQTGVEVALREPVAIISFPQRIFQKKEAGEFAAAMAQLKRRHLNRFVVDLSNCEYVSSEGLAAVAKCWKWCHEQGKGSLAVVLPLESESEVRNLFEIIGLSRIIGSALRSTLEDAVSYVKTF